MKPVRLQVPSLQPNRVRYLKRGRDSTPSCSTPFASAKIGVVEVVDGGAGNLRFLLQVIGADDAGIERAEALPLPIVAHLEVDALVPLPSDVHDPAIIDPVDQCLEA